MKPYQSPFHESPEVTRRLLIAHIYTAEKETPVDHSEVAKLRRELVECEAEIARVEDPQASQQDALIRELVGALAESNGSLEWSETGHPTQAVYDKGQEVLARARAAGYGEQVNPSSNPGSHYVDDPRHHEAPKAD